MLIQIELLQILIAQAEHDVNAQSILITNNQNLIKLVNISLKNN